MKAIKWVTIITCLTTFLLSCSASVKNDWEALVSNPENHGQIKDYVLSKLIREEYQSVEDLFDYLIDKKTRNKDGFHLSSTLYEELAESYKRGELYLYDAWCEQTSHHSAFVVRGLYRIYEGWRVRGSQAASLVPEENFRTFRDKLLLAKHNYTTAYRLNQKDPNIAAGMLMIVVGTAAGEEEREKWFERGKKADETFYGVYSAKLTDLLPKWGGDWQEALNFAQNLYDNPPRDSMTYLLMLLIIDEFFDDMDKISTLFSSNEEIETFIDDVATRYKSEYPDGTYVEMKKNQIAGLINFFNDREDEAEINFNKMIEMEPDYDWPYYMIGQIYLKNREQYAEAEPYYNKAIELDSTSGLYHQERAYIYYKLKNYDACITDVSHAIKRGHVKHKDYFLRASCYEGKKEYLKAVMDYTRALEKEPDNSFSLYARARLYSNNLDTLELAIADYEKLVESGRNTKQPRRLIDSLKKRQEKRDNALKDPKYAGIQNPKVAQRKSEKEIINKRSLKEMMEMLNQFRKDLVENDKVLSDSEMKDLVNIEEEAYKLKRDSESENPEYEKLFKSAGQVLSLAHENKSRLLNQTHVVEQGEKYLAKNPIDGPSHPILLSLIHYADIEFGCVLSYYLNQKGDKTWSKDPLTGDLIITQVTESDNGGTDTFIHYFQIKEAAANAINVTGYEVVLKGVSKNGEELPSGLVDMIVAEASFPPDSIYEGE
ncbi:MAG: hypothetical protein D6B25_19840 [Desulfobulbaceae bacterium]|nr:MAG: hypothetical protein D6B25_19840 [Desulfobulbaceae bacterium]